MKIGLQSEFGKFNEPDKEEEEAGEYQAPDELCFFVIWRVVFIQWTGIYLIVTIQVISISLLLADKAR